MTGQQAPRGDRIGATPPRTSGTYDRMATLFEQKNYELLGELGRGGMGVVYLARDTKLGRKVAIKTLSPDRASRDNSVARFEREARTFAQIRHPHIATLYEYGEAGAIQYLALEYIDGCDLESERRRGKKWPVEEAVKMIVPLAQALEYTHGQGVLHRDIKPGNILIERESGRVVLTDFGLAKGRKDETLTASGFAVGTPAYMAPEQITDQFNVRPDGRADVFSLGTVFYEMLAAEHPFIGQDDLKTMRNIVQKTQSALSETDSSIPSEIDRVLALMLKKHPKDRIAGAGDVHKLLSDWLAGKDINERLDALDSSSAAKKAERKAQAPAPAKPPASDRPATPSAETQPLPRGGKPDARQQQAAAPPAATPPQPQAPAPPPQVEAGGGLPTKTVIVIIALVGVAMLIFGLLIGAFL